MYQYQYMYNGYYPDYHYRRHYYDRDYCPYSRRWYDNDCYPHRRHHRWHRDRYYDRW